MEPLKAALRLLRHRPGLALFFIITLGLGVGLVGAAWSIVEGTVRADLPFPNANRLVTILLRDPGTDSRSLEVQASWLAPLRADSAPLEKLAAYSTFFALLTDAQSGTLAYEGAQVTHDFFPLLGAQAALGRLFDAEDARPEAPAVALLSFRVWQNQFQGDPNVLGRKLLIDRVERVVIGVMPEGFAFPMEQDVWTVFRQDPATWPEEDGGTVELLGQLSPGSTLSSLRAKLATLSQQVSQAQPSEPPPLQLFAEPYVAAHSDPRVRAAIQPMLLAALTTLLIACANAACLLLERGGQRSRQSALRAALGAGRGRLVLESLGEALALGLPAALLALLVAQLALRLFEWALSPANILHGFWAEFRLSPLTALAIAGLSLVAALVSGLVPAIIYSRPRAGETLRDASSSLERPAVLRFSRALVVGEIALACCLLVAAGMLIQSVRAILSKDPGFKPEGLLVAKLSLYQAGQLPPGEQMAFLDGISERLRGVPEVESTAFTTFLPTQGGFAGTFQLERQPDSLLPQVRWMTISSGYFATLQASLFSGRDFTLGDTVETPPVAIVNLAFVRRYLPGLEPLGERLRLAAAGAPAQPWAEVVGVVNDFELGAVEEKEIPPAVFLAIRQAPRTSIALVARTHIEPALLAARLCSEVSQVRSLAACFDATSVEVLLSKRRWSFEAFRLLFVSLGSIALGLATLGIYGVVAMAVRRRRQELGVRLALGEAPARLRRRVLGLGFSHLGWGFGLGLPLAWALSSSLSRLLFEVRPWEPQIYLAAAAILAGAVIAACWIPAARASKLDPAEVLRSA